LSSSSLRVFQCLKHGSRKLESCRVPCRHVPVSESRTFLCSGRSEIVLYKPFNAIVLCRERSASSHRHYPPSIITTHSTAISVEPKLFNHDLHRHQIEYDKITTMPPWNESFERRLLLCMVDHTRTSTYDWLSIAQSMGDGFTHEASRYDTHVPRTDGLTRPPVLSLFCQSD